MPKTCRQHSILPTCLPCASAAGAWFGLTSCCTIPDAAMSQSVMATSIQTRNIAEKHSRRSLKRLKSRMGGTSSADAREYSATAVWAAGELASERERSRQAVQPGIAEAQSPNRGYSSPRRGQVAVCLSPSAARSQQQPAAAAQPCVLGQTAARSAAAFPVAAPTSTVPQVCTVGLTLPGILLPDNLHLSAVRYSTVCMLPASPAAVSFHKSNCNCKGAIMATRQQSFGEKVISKTVQNTYQLLLCCLEASYPSPYATRCLLMITGLHVSAVPASWCVRSSFISPQNTKSLDDYVVC